MPDCRLVWWPRSSLLEHAQLTSDPPARCIIARVNAQDLIDAVESIAPRRLAEPWDNTGLLVGDPASPIDGPVLLCIDLTDAVLAEALEAGAGAILAYHPPIFSGIKSVTPATREGRTVLACAANGIALYAPHTALDAAPSGLAEWLVRLAGDGGIAEPITPHTASDPNAAHKLVTFIPTDPPSLVGTIRDALARAGAGTIGAYTHCAFTTPGTGSFHGGDATNPSVGEKGRLETVSELRLETVVPSGKLPAIIRALHGAHPYDEPAFDLIPLADKPDPATGGGRLMTLDVPAKPSDIAQQVKAALGVNAIKLASNADDPVTRVAACPGAGGSMIDDAIAQGAELFLTGEMRHHDALAALEKGCAVLLAGHTNTERPYLPTLAKRLVELVPGASFTVSTTDRAPFVNLT